jgi:hypothetical protein
MYKKLFKKSFFFISNKNQTIETEKIVSSEVSDISNKNNIIVDENKSSLDSLSSDLLIEIISFIIDIKSISTFQLINKNIKLKLFYNDELSFNILRNFFKPLLSINFGNITKDKRLLSPIDMIQLIKSRGKKTFNANTSAKLQGKEVTYIGQQQISRKLFNKNEGILIINKESGASYLDYCPCCSTKIESNNEDLIHYYDEKLNDDATYNIYTLKVCSNGIHNFNVRCNHCNYNLKLQINLKKKCALDNMDFNLNYYGSIKHKHGKEFNICSDCHKDICSKCLINCKMCNKLVCCDCDMCFTRCGDYGFCKDCI